MNTIKYDKSLINNCYWSYETTWLSFEVSIIAGNVHRALKFCMCFYHLFDVSRCFKFVMYPCSWVVQPPGVGLLQPQKRHRKCKTLFCYYFFFIMWLMFQGIFMTLTCTHLYTWDEYDHHMLVIILHLVFIVLLFQ